VVADFSHHCDEEKDRDPDLHLSEKSDLDPHKVMWMDPQTLVSKKSVMFHNPYRPYF
jgi:hypothetical protein